VPGGTFQRGGARLRFNTSSTQSKFARILLMSFWSSLPHMKTYYLIFVLLYCTHTVFCLGKIMKAWVMRRREDGAALASPGPAVEGWPA
jgi:hypothetical protein